MPVPETITLLVSTKGRNTTRADLTLQNIDVLILDDFLTIGIDQPGQEDLTKIIFDRDGRLPTIVASQTSAAYWLEALPDRVGADSLVSRLNTGQRINLGDYDMRQHLAYTHNTTD